MTKTKAKVSYQVKSEFSMSVMESTMKMKVTRSSYVWITPFDSKKEAEEHAAYIKRNSRAHLVEVVEVKE
jgi:hypothetical protein